MGELLLARHDAYSPRGSGILLNFSDSIRSWEMYICPWFGTPLLQGRVSLRIPHSDLPGSGIHLARATDLVAKAH